MVPVPFFASPKLTVPNLVLDGILAGKGATKESRIKLGKVGHKQVTKVCTIFRLFNRKSLIQNFGNLCFVKRPLFSPILFYFQLINEEHSRTHFRFWSPLIRPFGGRCNLPPRPFGWATKFTTKGVLIVPEWWEHIKIALGYWVIDA